MPSHDTCCHEIKNTRHITLLTTNLLIICSPTTPHNIIISYTTLVPPVKCTQDSLYNCIMLPSSVQACTNIWNLLRTKASQGCTKTTQGHPKLSGTADNDGQWQGPRRMQLKLWCFATWHPLVLNLDGWRFGGFRRFGWVGGEFRRFGWVGGEFRRDNLCWCYTLSHPETRRVLSDCTMGFGLRRVPLFRSLCSIHHHVYSIYSSIPKLCPPPCFMCPNFTLFHVSVLLTFLFPLFYFPIPKPQPWDMPNSHYPDMSSFNTYVPNLMYVPQSEINIDCPSNSLSKLPNSHLKFEDSRHLVAQHIQ